MEWIKIRKDFIEGIIKDAEKKKWNNRGRPLSEASIEAECCIDIAKYILENSESLHPPIQQ